MNSNTKTPKLKFDTDDNALILHAVVKLNVIDGLTMVAAWRKYLKISQKDLAGRTGMTQSALSQIEKSGSNHRATLEKLASAMNISIAQLTD